MTREKIRIKTRYMQTNRFSYSFILCLHFLIYYEHVQQSAHDSIVKKKEVKNFRKNNQLGDRKERKVEEQENDRR